MRFKRWRLVLLGSLALLLALFGGLWWIFPRWLQAVGAGKSPRTAYASVIRKERVQLKSTLQSGVDFDVEYRVYYRIDEFTQLDPAAREAVLKGERARYAKEGPRMTTVRKEEFEALSEGSVLTVLYAYYPSVLWGTSDDIRVPW